MNRVILFRGKNLINEEWVYGSLVSDSTDELRIIKFKEIIADGHHLILNQDDSPQFFIQESIGQFIGLTDKNNKKIFEGDIVKVFNKLVQEYEIGVVKMSELGTWSILIKIDKCSPLTIPMFEFIDNHLSIVHSTNRIEVIGNIIDNSELLKGKS